ncbi:hypothetical protein BDV06DRAFT_218143 [Aspergillus oleicola]
MAKLPDTSPQAKDTNVRPRVIDPNLQPRRPPHPKTVADIRQTKEYKAASRRWLSTIVALPILIYSSWALYERNYLRKERKRLDDLPPLE